MPYGCHSLVAIPPDHSAAACRTAAILSVLGLAFQGRQATFHLGAGAFYSIEGGTQLLQRFARRHHAFLSPVA